MTLTLPTTLLVIDDDPIVLRRVAKETLRSTNLGVLTAEDLPTAVELLRSYSIGAILADIHFRADTRDDERQLFNGLDFLRYAAEVVPHIPTYVMSMDADDCTSRQQADDMKLNITAWYDKLHPDGQFAPWVRIERDLILRALKSQVGFRERAKDRGENVIDLLTDEYVAEKLQGIFNFPRLTYLQYFPTGLGCRPKKPIEAYCWPSAVGVKATAAGIPLLTEAEGEDVVEALERLAEIIVNETKALNSEGELGIVDFARFVRERLNEVIQIESDSELRWSE